MQKVLQVMTQDQFLLNQAATLHYLSLCFKENPNLFNEYREIFESLAQTSNNEHILMTIGENYMAEKSYKKAAQVFERGLSLEGLTQTTKFKRKLAFACSYFDLERSI